MDWTVLHVQVLNTWMTVLAVQPSGQSDQTRTFVYEAFLKAPNINGKAQK